MRTESWPVILFDLDGTVAHTIDLILASYAHATKSVLGRQADEEESRSWIGQTLADTFSRRYPGQVDALLESYLTWNLDNMERLVTPYPGMDALLRDLQAAGRTLGIVTSKKRASAERTLAAVGLAHVVRVVVSIDDTVEHKPSPAPLLQAFEWLGVRARDAVYVGDARYDLAAARAAGSAGIGVTWGAGRRAELEAEEPLAVVDDMDALRALLLG